MVRIVVCFIFFILLASCLSSKLPINKMSFLNEKWTGVNGKIKLNGYFYTYNNENYLKTKIFYDDGYFIDGFGYIDLDIEQYENMFLNNHLTKYYDSIGISKYKYWPEWKEWKSEKMRWGVYRFKTDTLVCQSFERPGFADIFVYEDYYLIENDTTLVFFKSIQKKNTFASKDEIRTYDDKKIFKFKKYDSKPVSTNWLMKYAKQN